MDALQDFPMLWAEMSPEEKRTTFSLLIESLRVGRGDGCIQVKLRLRFMEEVILDLPIHSIWNKARKGIEKPPIGLRQLAYLALAAEGYTDRQIAGRWKVGTNDVRCSRRRAVAQMGASTVAEAIELARPYIAKWREYLPLDSRHGSPGAGMISLSDAEMQVLRGIASGKTDGEMAGELAVPPATISGRRRRLRDKLSVTSKEALVAKAVELGIIGPNEPSSALLLRAYKRLASPEYADLVAQHRLKAPTPRQMQCLQALADGLTAEQTGEKMGVGFQAVVFMRQRLWRIVRADSLRTALEQVQQLGILDWPDIPAEEGKKCQP